jgi:hypothetical protein
MLFCKIFPSVSMYEVKEMVYHRSQARKASVPQPAASVPQPAES